MLVKLNRRDKIICNRGVAECSQYWVIGRVANVQTCVSAHTTALSIAKLAMFVAFIIIPGVGFPIIALKSA